MTQIKLLANGGFNGTDTCIGKVVEAVHYTQGAYKVPLEQLLSAGYEDDGSGCNSFLLFSHELEVVDG